MKTKIIIVSLLIASCNLDERHIAKTDQSNIVNDIRVNARFMTQAEALNDKQVYFNVLLEKNQYKPDEKTLTYLNFEIQQDFMLVENGDTIPAIIAHRVNNGKEGSFEYMVAFDGIDLMTTGNLDIIYSDKIFGIGIQHFEFKKKDLIN